ncbi:MAG TPA: hypothetical protein VFA06_18625 [Actinocrinis sp.]|uniref:hypothetical protein n=1 Tax=Actinocrinis sp. TaxID=1920516 RepID=UPI002D2D81EC|nr:hypothetical protein [Actinocrinis sp.]HZU57895.1 hypothetical protein [Actinocrinis sp.]
MVVGEWIADAPTTTLVALGRRVDVLTGRRPVADEAIIRRPLARIDADALDRAVGRWLGARRREPAAALRFGACTRRAVHQSLARDGQDSDYRIIGVDPATLALPGQPRAREQVQAASASVT